MSIHDACLFLSKVINRDCRVHNGTIQVLNSWGIWDQGTLEPMARYYAGLMNLPVAILELAE